MVKWRIDYWNDRYKCWHPTWWANDVRGEGEARSALAHARNVNASAHMAGRCKLTLYKLVRIETIEYDVVETTNAHV